MLILTFSFFSRLVFEDIKANLFYFYPPFLVLTSLRICYNFGTFVSFNDHSEAHSLTQQPSSPPCSLFAFEVQNDIISLILTSFFYINPRIGQVVVLFLHTLANFPTLIFCAELMFFDDFFGMPNENHNQWLKLCL